MTAAASRNDCKLRCTDLAEVPAGYHGNMQHAQHMEKAAALQRDFKEHLNYGERLLDPNLQSHWHM